ncbi:hypothetical protein [Solwaraspora sp. WMMD792]|uniref:DUF4760 domain-containing protein n=1 Tax=Solwaraspora sp. WMMD792 TaxID=3016099 RepID=UPI0024164E70|nr:hypothetical protein [Solwaraspora sp. WMMD792]MDG4774824.1 hypothetical protein [Solwaraspora sp. WMMD792]
MPVETLTNLAAIVLSVVSLTVSVVLAVRQNRTASAGYALPVVLEIFDQFRTQEFFDAREYIFDRLNQEYDPPVAYSDLPGRVRMRVRTVAGRYDDLGKLVAHGIVDEKLIIGSNGTAIRRVWECVAPFVLAERAKTGAATWRYLEDLAGRAARTPPTAVYAKLGLRHYTAPRPDARQA